MFLNCLRVTKPLLSTSHGAYSEIRDSFEFLHERQIIQKSKKKNNYHAEQWVTLNLHQLPFHQPNNQKCTNRSKKHREQRLKWRKGDCSCPNVERANIAFFSWQKRVARANAQSSKDGSTFLKTQLIEILLGLNWKHIPQLVEGLQRRWALFLTMGELSCI